MSAINPNAVFNVPVRLVVAPSSLVAGTYPYGTGTACGAIRGAFIDHQQESGEILDRAKASVIGGWKGIERWWLGFDEIQWDTTILGLTMVTSGFGVAPVHAPGIQTAGSPLLLAPYDDLNKPAVICYAPIPATARQRFEFYTRTKLNPKWLFRLAQNSNSKELQVGLLSALSLT